MYRKSNGTGVTIYFNSTPLTTWFPPLNYPPLVLYTFPSLSAIYLRTAGRILQGCLSVPSLQPSWWFRCHQNETLLWSTLACEKEKVTRGKINWIGGMYQYGDGRWPSHHKTWSIWLLTFDLWLSYFLRPRWPRWPPRTTLELGFRFLLQNSCLITGNKPTMQSGSVEDPRWFPDTPACFSSFDPHSAITTRFWRWLSTCPNLSVIIFPNNVFSHVQLTFFMSSQQSTDDRLTSTDNPPDDDLSPACWRPPPPGVTFHLLAPLFEPNFLVHFKYFWQRFPKSDQKFQVYSLLDVHRPYLCAQAERPKKEEL